MMLIANENLPKKPMCEHCRFFRDTSKNRATTFGECMVHPPTVVTNPTSNVADQARPIVYPHDFCSYYTEKP